MKLKFLSIDTLSDLKINNNAYLKYYYRKDSEWFDKYLSEKGRVLESNITVGDEDLKLSRNPEYSLSDSENVKILYTALIHLTPAQATQERLWAGLAHIHLRDYIFYRLEKELEEENGTRIYSALFYKYGPKRSIFIHIISRLWWAGFMTYDEKNEKNPFWLTDFFTKSDFSARCTVFFSSNFTSNRDITLGILEALYNWSEKGHHIKREHFIQATKHLNIMGGATILDVLTREDVIKIVNDEVFEVPEEK